ncbi:MULTISPECIES: histidine--tRNA ligase [Bradyrhizobium]|jgi:histidyl-tRNA synthetase|uniref:Histidine--tRNA ligase n=3 Tax=Bradyrhizobium TaxID=374 RepID=A0ABS5G5M4_9BRAD|nr:MULTISPECIES: histidine--tRNA ligase [Bradyrhizobium]MBR1136612.1 histidine--tRNA ligase [Bradyrhizobium denitrificans]MDU1494519.1 histidine--tRNA ligase [Bradyrhizobium sp.]MDU1544677.1 histidine--tRNA ligase [Bradyrhizobium sp.]MDU1809432.1 histidine--tRNA ligase [Bradyrhizobium sp.]MDU2926857.1 histidine--tRNA ligase [Bradyrhizobium sp.]
MSDKPKKQQKLKARLPRGLEDRGPAAIAATREMVEKIRAVYERYGFEPVETPAFEYTDALGKFLPDQDRPNEGVFSFQDDDEQWISLRYDLTAPLARYVGERYGTDGLVLPYRSYRSGYVFRNEKPGPGRFRQFMQFDADTVGSASPAADAEMCMMAADTMEALGLKGHFIVKVSNRKVLDGVRESLNVTDDVQWLTVMRAIDKLDRLGWEGVEQLLGVGRKDESGDFAKGAGLSNDAINMIKVFLEGGLPVDVSLAENPHRPMHDMKTNHPGTFVDNLYGLSQWHGLIGQTKSGAEGLKDLTEIVSFCEAAGYGSNRITVDVSVVRGLEYYTGPVFEVELLLETKDEKGRPVRFGSVGGGGRYDGLVSRFRGEPVPATGFSIGVSRLQAALTLLGKLDTRPAFGPVVVTVFDRDRVADYQKMVATLRNHGIRAELYLGNPKNMGNQLKYADRRNAPCVIIQGSDEKARGEVQIKDLIEGAKAAAAIASNQEWRESRPAQVSAKEDELVAAVREVLARHDVSWG